MNLKGERVHTILPMSPIIKSKQILGLVLSSFVLFPHGGRDLFIWLEVGIFFFLFISQSYFHNNQPLLSGLYTLLSLILKVLVEGVVQH